MQGEITFGLGRKINPQLSVCAQSQGDNSGRNTFASLKIKLFLIMRLFVTNKNSEDGSVRVMSL